METQLAEQRKIRESMVTLEGEIKNSTEHCKDLAKSNAKLSEDNERLKDENAMLREEANMKNNMLPSIHDSIRNRNNSTSDLSSVRNVGVFHSRDSTAVMGAEITNTKSEQKAVPSWLQNEGLQKINIHEQELDSTSKTCGNNNVDCRNDKARNNMQMSDDGPDAEYLDCKGEDGSQGRQLGTETCTFEGITILSGAHFQDAAYSKMDTAVVEGAYDREKDLKLKGR